MLIRFLLIYCIYLTFASKYTIDYCPICKNKYYTMCKRENDTINISCINYTTTAMTPKIQDIIVTLHNQLRNVIASGMERRGNPGPQPPAGNMFLLRWNNDFAAKAQRWVNQCKPMLQENQQNKCKVEDRFQIGEYGSEMLEDKLPFMNEKIAIQIILQWYNEVVHVNFMTAASSHRSMNNTKKCTHYSQMMWALAKYVGCAYISLTEQPLKSKMYVKLNRLICHYGTPPGKHSSFLYKIGKPCSNCAEKCNKKYRALCDDETANNYTAINISSEAKHIVSTGRQRTMAPSHLHEKITNVFQYNLSNNNTTLATNAEVKKMRRKQIRLPHHREKHFVTSPQTLNGYNFSTQKQILREWSNKTEMNSTTQYVTIKNRPKVLNLFQNLLQPTRAESDDNNVINDMESIMRYPIKPSYFDYIDNIGFRSIKDIENKSQLMNLRDYSQKIENINNNNSFNNDTIKARKSISVSTIENAVSVYISTIANTISEHVQKELHNTKRSKSQKTTESSTMKSTDSPQVHFFSSEEDGDFVIVDQDYNGEQRGTFSETQLIKVTGKLNLTATELPTNPKELSSAEIDSLTSYFAAHKSKTEVDIVDDNCSLKHSRAVTPFRLYLREGDPCYCLYRIKSNTSKLQIKYHIVMSIFLFCVFL